MRARTRTRDARGQALARGLAWLGLGLGATQLATPATVARLIGVRPDRQTRRALRAIAVRELATSGGLLVRPRKAGWAWARVGGDALDLALLEWALWGRGRAEHRGRIAAAAGAVLGILVLDAVAARRLSRTAPARGLGAGGTRQVVAAVTIRRSPEEVYRFWRELSNLPRFMRHLRAVEVIDERRSRWQVAGPAGAIVEWEAEIIDDRPGERLSWRSVRGDVDSGGTVSFRVAPGGRGTEVAVELTYRPPAGRLGVLVAGLFGRAPGQQTRHHLRELKQVLEVGEVVHSDASLHPGRHPARPSGQRRRRRAPVSFAAPATTLREDLR